MPDSYRNRILTEGFAILPDRVAQPEIATLARAISKRQECTYPGMRRLLEKVPEVKEYCNSDRLQALVEPILGRSAKLVRALFFDKNPQANWGVTWHQDTTIALRERIETPGFQTWTLKDGIPHVRPPVALLERDVNAAPSFGCCKG